MALPTMPWPSTFEELLTVLRHGPPVKLSTMYKPPDSSLYYYGLNLAVDEWGVFVKNARPAYGSVSHPAGIWQYDRLIEVNHYNVENMTLKEICRRIDQHNDHVTLLVASPHALFFYKWLGVCISSMMPSVVRYYWPKEVSGLQMNLNPMSWPEYLNLYQLKQLLPTENARQNVQSSEPFDELTFDLEIVTEALETSFRQDDAVSIDDSSMDSYYSTCSTESELAQRYFHGCKEPFEVNDQMEDYRVYRLIEPMPFPDWMDKTDCVIS